MRVVKFKNVFFFLFIVFISNFGWSQINITAIGDQFYCPQSEISITTEFNISDDSNSIETIFIQISEGYVQGEDELILNNATPNISKSWKASEGKLILSWTGGTSVDYNELINAVKSVVFKSSSLSPSDKSFSITISDANYLPSTDHFYQYISDVGITWQDAKTTAESLEYYGLPGYLATIMSPEEKQLTGEQASGAGWIGGSDAETEGVWKWVTGPEGLNGGTIFWNGLANGSTPNYAFWNTNEPNQAGDEDYAHITAPSVGIRGSWNDLSNTGATSGDYQPKGYIVEYGGTLGEPTINIYASTKISTLKVNSTTNGTSCGPSEISLSAEANNGSVYWFDSLTSETPLDSGTNYTTPLLTTTTTYYVLASKGVCFTGERTPVMAIVNDIPTIISTNDVTICDAGSGTLMASASSGTINWYASATGGISLEEGNTFLPPSVDSTTTYYIDVTENGCSSTRFPIIINIESDTFPIQISLEKSDLTITENSSNNTISINPQSSNFNVENYEYALDHEFGIFQDELFFENITPGIHTVFIRDKSNCGLAQIKVGVLGFPNFFTPNNDGYNDTWNIIGLDNNKYQLSAIKIFNRFGILLAIINSEDSGWDGIYNDKPVSASDYWFEVQLIDENGNIHNKFGHFSLIRR